MRKIIGPFFIILFIICGFVFENKIAPYGVVNELTVVLVNDGCPDGEPDCIDVVATAFNGGEPNPVTLGYVNGEYVVGSIANGDYYIFACPKDDKNPISGCADTVILRGNPTLATITMSNGTCDSSSTTCNYNVTYP